ncbi:sodium:solute symporter family protein [uncultured Alistipes sp.]|uniref:sodium:solute symporter family protein n=1 Tax=uncultured Alistipes sp. TaxID=538949 RepID=UPI0025985882|nr:sodium:solute symporter family protein [uncultured Alistipes sp.]
MGTLDYVTILLFAAGVMLAGISFSSTGKNMKSFFAGGGNVPWWISGLSLFMGFFSAGTFVVWGSIAYSHGWVSVTIQLTMAAAGLAVGFFIAPRWNRTGCLTAAEYITRRFGVSTQKMYTYLFLFISLFTTGAFLYPIAKIIEVTADIPLNTSILLLGAFSILYVTIGGLRAVVVTDVLQFLILFAAVIIVIPLSLMKVGGAEAFLAKVPEGFFQTVSGDYTWVFIIAFMFYNLFFLGGNWAYVQRYTSVSTPRNARKVGWLFGVLYLVSPILWMLPPMIYRVYNPGLEGLEAENAYLLMCKEAMPSGLLGLMLGGMIFATASSLNATLNISAGVFTNDIFKRLSPSTSEKGLMRIARWSTIGFGVLAIVVALLIPLMGGIVNVVISVAALTGVPLYLPLIWSLFSRNLNGRVILTTTVVSLAINALFKFVTPLMDFSLDRAEEMLVGVLVPALLLAGYEIYHRICRPGEQIPMIEKAPAATVEDGDASNNRFSIMVIGIGAILTGLFIAVLGALADEHKMIPLGMGLLLLAIGVTAYSYSKKKS